MKLNISTSCFCFDFGVLQWKVGKNNFTAVLVELYNSIMRKWLTEFECNPRWSLILS